MRQQMEEALRGSGADYAEIRIERAQTTEISFRGREIDRISSSGSLGGTARAAVKGGWGIVTFNDVSDLRGRVNEAVACAQLVGHEKTALADVERIEEMIPAPAMSRDFRGVALSEKKQVTEQYNGLMLGVPGIHTTQTSYRDVYREVYFASSEGSYFEETRPDVVVSLNAVARVSPAPSPSSWLPTVITAPPMLQLRAGELAAPQRSL